MEGEGRRAYLAALRWLARRALSVHEVTVRLRRRGIDEQSITEAVSRLVAEGVLDDAAYARAYIHDRLLFHPVGRRVLRAELAQRGVPAAVAEEALGEVDVAREEEALRDYLTRHGFRPDCPGDERRRWRDRLLQRGFCGEAIRRALKGSAGDSAEELEGERPEG